MPDDSKSGFQFFPRPEASAMCWDSLLPPVQDAVRDLLVRLDGAIKKVGQHDERSGSDGLQVVTNCFRVFGDRGTGKSTVLLSAQKAVDPQGKFFPKVEESKKSDALKAAAQKSAEALRSEVVWLDVLDMEPLPPRANLLTSLLTRVREVLDKGNQSGKPAGLTSLFEESENSARNKLQRLISDAALMWEDINEDDTRSRANRQVATADIYAHFRERFHEALHSLCGELGRRRGSDKSPAIVLPIDNIDRSTEHLSSIVKLAQMVNCHHLWLIMAGDRVDLETFLERAYWKELIRVGSGAGADGKTGPDGEDEAFVMARRQAAAASQKLVPASHRIEVQRVDAEDTLRFCPSGHRESAAVGKKDAEDKTIYELLAEVSIPVAPGGPQFCFVDLLEMEACLNVTKRTRRSNQDPNLCIESPKSPIQLTLAAQDALCLPARGVLDLWQLAHGVVNDRESFDRKPGADDDFRAEKIARTMLRNVIPPSEMSNELGRRVQDQIIRRTIDGGTMLDFDTAGLKVLRLTAPDFEIFSDIARPLAAPSGCAVRSTIRLRAFHRVILQMNRKLQDSASGGGRIDDREKVELPQLVAAWLVILHDICIWSKRSAVVGMDEIRTAPLVRISHKVVLPDHLVRQSDELRWLAPGWNTFLAHDVFREKWAKVSAPLLRLVRSADNANPGLTADALMAILMCGWVACALETCLVFEPGLSLDLFRLTDASVKSLRAAGVPEETVKKLEPLQSNEYVSRERFLEAIKPVISQAELMKWQDCILKHALFSPLICFRREGDSFLALTDFMARKHEGDDRKTGWKTEDVQECTTHVLISAATLYSRLQPAKASSTSRFASVIDSRLSFMRDWLEQELPLLFSYLYLPTSRWNGHENESPIAAVCAVLSQKKAESVEDKRAMTKLLQSWQEKWPFFRTKLEEQLAKLFNARTESANSAAGDIPSGSAPLEHSWKHLGPFGSLHRQFE